MTSADTRLLFRRVSGKIQAGEAKLSGLRKMLEEQLDMKVDVSIILKEGPFDNGPTINIP